MFPDAAARRHWPRCDILDDLPYPEPEIGTRRVRYYSETDCMIRVVLAQTRGFCAGVERAIEVVERALKKYGPPIYVRHEIVHNRHVVEDLRTRGAVFVDELDEIPPGAITVFSAHGVAKRVEEAAAERGLPVIDATCPLVAKVHNEGRRYARQDRELVLVGHAGHAEVEGTIGQVPAKVHLVQTVEDVATLDVKDPGKLAYITQTTLSVDDTRGIIAALKARFPTIVGPDVDRKSTRLNSSHS